MKPVINTVLLSFGMSGRVFHAPFITVHKGFRLTGAWERSNKQIEAYYPDVTSYASLDETLNDDSIDLVVVNTPTCTHYEYARRALQANKHVVVEKAFTTTVAEAEALKRLAERQGKQIAVYQNRRWDSDFMTTKQVIESGVLGDINEMEIHYDRYSLTLSPKKHKEEPNAGAGMLKDLGPHAIDQALCLFGMPDALFADIRIARPVSLVDDYFDILLYYPAFRVRLKAGMLVKEPLPAFIVHGTKGSFWKPRADVQEANLQKAMKPGTPDWGAEPETAKGHINYDDNGTTVAKDVTAIQGNYLAFYNGVYEALTKNLPMPVTADDGIRVMKIIEAATESSRERRVVEIHT